MATNSEIYSDNFVYRKPVEPTQEYVVPVALVYGSIAPTNVLISQARASFRHVFTRIFGRVN